MYFLPERSRSTGCQARALLTAALPSIIVDPHLCLNLNTLKNQEGLKITANLECAHPCCKRLVSTIKVALPPEDLPPKLGFWTGSHQKENQDSINSGQDQTFHSTLLGIFLAFNNFCLIRPHGRKYSYNKCLKISKTSERI